MRYPMMTMLLSLLRLDPLELGDENKEEREACFICLVATAFSSEHSMWRTAWFAVYKVGIGYTLP